MKAILCIVLTVANPAANPNHDNAAWTSLLAWASQPAVASLYLPVKLPRPDVASLARRLGRRSGRSHRRNRGGQTSTAVNWFHLKMIAAAIRGPPMPATSHPIEPLAKTPIISRLIHFRHALVDESNASLLLESFNWHRVCCLREIKTFLLCS